MKSVQRRGRAHAGRRTFLGCQFDVQNPNVLAGLLIDWIFMLVRGNGHAVNHVVIAKVIAVAKLLVAGKWKFYIKFALPLGLLLVSDKFIAMSRDTAARPITVGILAAETPALLATRTAVRLEFTKVFGRAISIARSSYGGPPTLPSTCLREVGPGRRISQEARCESNVGVVFLIFGDSFLPSINVVRQRHLVDLDTGNINLF